MSELGLHSLNLRPYEPADRDGIIHLIDSVYREYGDAICLEHADSDLLDIAGHYAAGAFVVVADSGGRIFGTHAALPLDAERRICTFRRLYLSPAQRGSDWGERLFQWAVDWAADNGFRRVEFWSDTRFARAHRFFQKMGFRRDGRTREMTDAWERYREHFFHKDLTPE